MFDASQLANGPYSDPVGDRAEVFVWRPSHWCLAGLTESEGWGSFFQPHFHVASFLALELVSGTCSRLLNARVWLVCVCAWRSPTLSPADKANHVLYASHRGCIY